MTFSRDNQQLLQLGHGLMTEFDNFIAFELHKPIIHHLKNIKKGEQVYIYGEQSTGCSHLAKATCVYHQNLQSVYLPLSTLKFLDRSMLEGIGQVDLICIEDIDQLAGNKPQQLILFDLINICSSHSVSMLLTAHIKPGRMDDWLPDLRTRFQAMCNWQMPSLNDDDKAKILMDWLDKQNMLLDVEVVHYSFKHINRDLSLVKSLLESFLKYCMKLKKKPNIRSLREFSS